MQEVKCDYCGNAAERVGGKAIYPHRPDLYPKVFYRCVPCNAYVGCHPGTTTPLGRLANPQLRKYKSFTHKVFDILWSKDRNSGMMSRYQAYGWLAKEMGLTREMCHIGMFTIEQCAQAISLCKAKASGVPDSVDNPD